MDKLTVMEEAFAQAYIETGKATLAYRAVYNDENVTDGSVCTMAYRKMKLPRIEARVAELKEALAKKHEITRDDLVAELQEAREMARNGTLPAVMVSATMGKGKLLGFDRVVIDHTFSLADVLESFDEP